MSLFKKQNFSHLYWLNLLLVFLGVVLSFILLKHHVVIRNNINTSPSLCSFNEVVDCDAVAASSYSEILGFPIAGFGVVFFVFFMFSSISLRREEKSYAYFVYFLSFLGFFGSLVYAFISYAMLKKVCLFCTGIYVISTILFFVNTNYFVSEWKNLRNLNFTFGNGRTNSLLLVLFLFIALSVFQFPNYYLKFFAKFERAQLPQISLEEIIEESFSRNSILIDVNSGINQDFIKGDLKAENTIIEFSDFECPHCRIASSKLSSILKRYPTRFNLIFKNYPLDSSCNSFMRFPMHKEACSLAELARCAGEYGNQSFWEMHDNIFSLNQINSEDLSILAASANLSLNQCLAEKRQVLNVKKDINLANSLKVRGTPTLFLLTKDKLLKIKSINHLESYIFSNF